MGLAPFKHCVVFCLFFVFNIKIIILSTQDKKKYLHLLQHYALKMVEFSFGNADREKELLNREEQILKSVKHRHVVRYVNSFFEDNVMCMVMEYCDGGTLHQYIRALKQKMNEDTFICFLEQITQGIKVSILRIIY